MQGLLRWRAVESRVGRAAQQPGGEAEECGVGGPAGVETADDVGVGRAVRPGHAEGEGGPAQRVDRPRLRRRQGPEQPDPAVEHQPGRRNACQQADLGVPTFARQRRPVGDRRGRPVGDFLLRGRQLDRAPGPRPLLPQLPHPFEQLQPATRVDVGLHPGVVEPLPAAHHGPAYLGGLELAGGIELEGPDQRRANLVGQQAGRPLGQHRRVQRGANVWCIEGLAAPVRLQVDHPAGRHERRNVGDGVLHAVAGPPLGQAHGLVEIGAARRVDRQELDPRQVVRREPRLGRCRAGLGQHLGGELVRDAELDAQGLPAGNRDRQDDA